jgi:phage shock protein A|tara:strand:+ start:911 stop:1819 length:909 start_codon:yes stop_codon:yes gene_type:complete
MGATSRFIVRWGLIGGLAVGGVTLLVGPQRVLACFDQLQQEANTVIDGLVDDPIVLRRQLEDLAKEYPARIAEIRGEVAKLEQQLLQFERDEKISRRVIELTTADLEALRSLVEDAEAMLGVRGSTPSLRFEGVRYDLQDAYTEGRRIRTVRANYEDRLASDRRQMGLLNEQGDRLGDVLENIEQEYETYRTQMWQLDREIDAIERNDHIIAMVEKQHETLTGFDRVGNPGNLDQVRSKLAEIRTVQESTILALTETGAGSDYETRARFDTSDQIFENPFTQTVEQSAEEPELNTGPYALLP